MSIITKMRRQTAVYWSFASIDQFGQKSFADAVIISCRWEDVSEEFLDVNGAVRMSLAKVYVDRDMALGGVLMLGALADITDEENPKGNIGAWEIRRFEKLPDLKAKEFLRTAIL